MSKHITRLMAYMLVLFLFTIIIETPYQTYPLSQENSTTPTISILSNLTSDYGTVIIGEKIFNYKKVGDNAFIISTNKTLLHYNWNITTNFLYFKTGQLIVHMNDSIIYIPGTIINVIDVKSTPPNTTLGIDDKQQNYKITSKHGEYIITVKKSLIRNTTIAPTILTITQHNKTKGWLIVYGTVTNVDSIEPKAFVMECHNNNKTGVHNVTIKIFFDNTLKNYTVTAGINTSEKIISLSQEKNKGLLTLHLTMKAQSCVRNDEYIKVIITYYFKWAKIITMTYSLYNNSVQV